MGIMIIFFILFAITITLFKDAMDKGKLELLGFSLLFAMLTMIAFTKVIESIWIF